MAYVAHIVEQIQHNLGFLVENGHMSREDADLVLSRLPGQESVAVSAPVVAPVTTVATPAPRRIPAPPVSTVVTKSQTVKARALWGYNEEGRDPDDLSFHPGDIIEIVEETNTDWWTGRINGRQGLLPSNHVEKISNGVPTTNTGLRSVPPLPTRSQTVLSPPPQYSQSASAPAMAPPREKAVYKPFGAAHHGADKPPPPGTGAVNSVGLQEAEGQDKKKSKYGSLGNTMAHSAAGGVGFGAGAAIGGGLVRAIF